MVYQMIVLALCVASALGGAIPAAKYPAGVNPHACPNYPYCDNVALAAHAAGHHNVAPYAAPAYAAYGHHGAVGVHGPAGPKVYPAGVDPHVCPNYPFCGPTPAHVAGHHAGAWAGAHHGAGAWAGAHHGAGAWAGAHNQWDDGSYHGDDGSYHGGEDDGSYHHWDDGSHDGHWDDGSYNHWDDGSYHHGGHHW
ncbi:uncharacterized protein [Hetaerina americana]|uniref:uncharacterized protein n=1 Tax=Hetaerina americana TaxID=62018 RepID=UPI003A7F4AA7